MRGKVDNDHAFCDLCSNTVCIDPKTEYPPKECNGGDWKIIGMATSTALGSSAPTAISPESQSRKE